MAFDRRSRQEDHLKIKETTPTVNAEGSSEKVEDSGVTGHRLKQRSDKCRRRFGQLCSEVAESARARCSGRVARPRTCPAARERPRLRGHGSTWSGAEVAGFSLFRNQGVFGQGGLGIFRVPPISSR